MDTKAAPLPCQDTHYNDGAAETVDDEKVKGGIAINTDHDVLICRECGAHLGHKTSSFIVRCPLCSTANFTQKPELTRCPASGCNRLLIHPPGIRSLCCRCGCVVLTRHGALCRDRLFTESNGPRIDWERLLKRSRDEYVPQFQFKDEENDERGFSDDESWRSKRGGMDGNCR